MDDEELNEYVDKFETLLGRKLDPGRGKAVPLRLTIDKVKMLHRSLLWYLVSPHLLGKFPNRRSINSSAKCVFVVDSVTFLYMLRHSFRYHGLGFKHLLTVFPFRPFAMAGLYKSPARTLTYWHRPHTSKTAIPVLFVHGIGIGLYPYVNFLAQLNRKHRKTPPHKFTASQASAQLDGDVGIIAIEIMPISFRITRAMPSQEQLAGEILGILRHHGWEKVVLVTHSYGSVIATHLLRNEVMSRICGPTLLIDPVSILLHFPDVAYNFTCRKPKRANEHQLYYFASMDMGVSHTLARHFFWNECILWREDMANRKITVVLSGRDLIVDAEAVGRYLTKENNLPVPTDWKHGPWRGEGLDIIWFEDLDHAQVFDTTTGYATLAKVVTDYSSKGAESPTSIGLASGN